MRVRVCAHCLETFRELRTQCSFFLRRPTFCWLPRFLWFTLNTRWKPQTTGENCAMLIANWLGLRDCRWGLCCRWWELVGWWARWPWSHWLGTEEERRRSWLVELQVLVEFRGHCTVFPLKYKLLCSLKGPVWVKYMVPLVSKNNLGRYKTLHPEMVAKNKSKSRTLALGDVTKSTDNSPRLVTTPPEAVVDL